MRPTQSTPGGCLIGAVGFFACLYAGVCLFVGSRLQEEELSEAEREYAASLGWHSGIGFVVGIALLWFGYKLAIRVEEYDSRDPKEPMLKF